MKKLQALAAFVAITAPAAVHAAVPTEIVTMFTDLTTDSQTVVKTYVIPAVAIMCGLWAVLRIGRKGAGKVG